MSKEVLPIHGDQHCLGGPDPIPCLGTSYMRRRRTSSTQTVAGNSSQVVVTYTAASDITDDASTFQAVTVSGFDAGIKVLRDGLYAVLFRVACGSLVTECAVAIWGIDDITDFFPYQQSFSDLAISTELTGTVAFTCRLDALQTVFATIRQDSGVSRTIAAGTFLELQYLAPASVDGRTW